MSFALYLNHYPPQKRVHRPPFSSPVQPIASKTAIHFSGPDATRKTTAGLFILAATFVDKFYVVYWYLWRFDTTALFGQPDDGNYDLCAIIDSGAACTSAFFAPLSGQVELSRVEWCGPAVPATWRSPVRSWNRRHRRLRAALNSLVGQLNVAHKSTCTRRAAQRHVFGFSVHGFAKIYVYVCVYTYTCSVCMYVCIWTDNRIRMNCECEIHKRESDGLRESF